MLESHFLGSLWRLHTPCSSMYVNLKFVNIVLYYVLLHILSFLLYSVFKVHLAVSISRTCGGRFALFVQQAALC